MYSTIRCNNCLNIISVLFLNAIALVQILNGQEASFDSTYFHTSISFDAKCNPIVSLSRSSGSVIDARLFLMEHDSIHDELEANKDQRRELKKLAKWQQEKLRSIAHLRDLGKRNDAIAEQEEAVKESEERLQEILLDHQMALMNKIQQRIYLWRLGVLEYLYRGDIGKQMNLKPNQIKKIESTVSELNDAWRKYKRKQSKQLTENLLEVLDDQQKKDLRSEFGSIFEQSDFEVHSIFLALVSESQLLPSKKMSTEYLDAMTNIGQFVVRNDGSWEQQKPFERLSEGSISYFLMSNLRTEVFFKKRIFPESKIEEIKQLQRSILDENKRLMAVRQTEIRSGVSPEKAFENQRESMRKDYARAKDWLDANLDKEQIKMITQAFRRRSLRCNGLLYELLGTTGKKLKLTRDQRIAIKSIATEQYDNFVEDSTRFEARLYSEIHKSLSGTQSNLLAPVTRWRARNLCPSISLLLLDNREWPRTRINLTTGKSKSHTPINRPPHPAK